MISSGLKSALILGVSGFVLGFIGPLILAPGANQGPLLGIFITGPAGVVLGGLIGLGVGAISRRGETLEPGSLLRLVPRVWNWILWGSAALAVIVILSGIIYIPWHERKYSPSVDEGSDIQNRDKSLTSLNVRSISDDEINLLRKFEKLHSLDFDRGWGVGEAKLTDAGLKNLSELDLPSLERLMLGHCNKITDAGMQYIARIRSLKHLYLNSCTQITDDALFQLTSSSAIETLDLRDCRGITDRGLDHLKKITRLKRLVLGGNSSVTSAGIEELQKALPNCKVIRHAR